jgi:hypothetical protein
MRYEIFLVVKVWVVVLWAVTPCNHVGGYHCFRVTFWVYSALTRTYNSAAMLHSHVVKEGEWSFEEMFFFCPLPGKPHLLNAGSCFE